MGEKPGNGADAAPVLKRKPGRPKGSQKVPGSGRRKGKPNALGREAREYLAKESQYLDVIARVSAGKAIRMSGPTGKKTWYYPDWADRKWALELISSKCIPTMSAAEVTGAEGAPLVPDEPVDIREVARRIAFILSLADTKPAAQAGARAQKGGGSLPQTATAPA